MILAHSRSFICLSIVSGKLCNVSSEMCGASLSSYSVQCTVPKKFACFPGCCKGDCFILFTILHKYSLCNSTQLPLPPLLALLPEAAAAPSGQSTRRRRLDHAVGQMVPLPATLSVASAAASDPCAGHIPRTPRQTARASIALHGLPAQRTVR